MSYFQIGSLSLPSIWLTVVASLFTASLFHLVVKRKKVGEWYWNGFFLYFLTWKLSYILFNFNLFIDMPLSVAYFNGGTKGHLLALALLSIYLLFFAWKKDSSVYKETTQLFFLFFISHEALIHIIERNMIESIVQVILLACFISLLFILKRKKRLITGQLFFLFLLLQLFVISLFNSILSVEALTFIWLGITAFLSVTFGKRGDPLITIQTILKIKKEDSSIE
ncbi:hypothetical protein [Mesobacillus maritimus]|uniref:hypothetical protein n=1 Tax=Mesobacillus maritimus TaxID=1643336 RepID=UPI003850F183